MLNRNFDLDIKSNHSLEKLNTFGLDVASESFFIVKNLKDLRNILFKNKNKAVNNGRKIGSKNSNSKLSSWHV